MKTNSNSAAAAIFWGGLIAGILDLTQAFIGFSLMGSTPFRILQRIAGGIFGTHSRDMGWASAAIGLVCHFTVAFGSRDRLLLGQQKTSSVRRTPSPVWSLLRRISIPVHVLRGYSAFGDRSSAV